MSLFRWDNCDFCSSCVKHHKRIKLTNSQYASGLLCNNCNHPRIECISADECLIVTTQRTAISLLKIWNQKNHAFLLLFGTSGKVLLLLFYMVLIHNLICKSSLQGLRLFPLHSSTKQYLCTDSRHQIFLHLVKSFFLLHFSW